MSQSELFPYGFSNITIIPRGAISWVETTGDFEIKNIMGDLWPKEK